MKIITFLAVGVLASVLVSGNAHATVCSTPLGQVTGLLSLNLVITDVDTTNVTCAAEPSSPFRWDNSSNNPGAPVEDLFATTADIDANSLIITMYTGATGGFPSDLVWTLTLPSGSLFKSIELTDSDFVFDSESTDTGDTLSFAGVGTSSAVFTIRATDNDNLYDFGETFTGVFDIEVTQANPVPEPSGAILALTCLGILGATRRRQGLLRID